MSGLGHWHHNLSTVLGLATRSDFCFTDGSTLVSLSWLGLMEEGSWVVIDTSESDQEGAIIQVSTLRALGKASPLRKTDFTTEKINGLLSWWEMKFSALKNSGHG